MSVASNQTIVTALDHGTVGVSFGGAGFLIFYYIGVIDILSRLGVIASSSKVAGASSGALITASHCSGLATREILNSAFDLARVCRKDGSCSGSLDGELRKLLQVHLPDDAWKKCKNSGFFAISSGTPLGEPEPVLVTDFSSQDDLITAAATSSYIPLWSGPGLFRLFRGLPAFDGGWTLRQPCPPGVNYCIRVSSRNPSWPQNRGIGGFLSLLGRANNNRGSMNADVTTERSAAVSYAQTQFISTGADGQPDPGMLKLAAESGVDIAPGVFHQVPFAQNQWREWSLSPADDSSLMTMYELGKADARAWAAYMGISKKTKTTKRDSASVRKSTAVSKNKQQGGGNKGRKLLSH